MKKWKILVTRETVLFERYLRIEGYSQMFLDSSRVKPKNILSINREGLTDVYIDTSEREKRAKAAWAEYKKGVFKTAIPKWEEIIENVKSSAAKVLKNKDGEALKNFIKYYKFGRAVIFYTEYLSTAFELKNNKKDIDMVIYWHETGEVETSKAWDSLRPFFRKVGGKFGYSFDEVMFMMPKEFIDLLDGKVKIPRKVLQERKKYYVLHLDNGKVKFYTGKQAKRVEDSELGTNFKKDFIGTSELRGVVACKGMAKGVVRIVNTTEDMKKFNSGDIMVSSMTTPRLVMAVKKSAAIVT